MQINQKIDICKETRAYAAESLFRVMQIILENNLEPSEWEVRDMWMKELWKNDSIFTDGWYCPPPHGIGVVIWTDQDNEQSRLNYASLRPETSRPRKDIRLNTNSGIMYVYASPVHKDTGIVGDFGMTMYFGKNKEIISHLQSCRQIVQQVFNYVEPGLTFSELAKHMKTLLTDHGLNNEIESRTSPSPADDVGHSIPFVIETLTGSESEILAGKDHDEIAHMISRKRLFIRESTDDVIQPGMAFTIEPRPQVVNTPNIPMVSFHVICVIYEDGEKELLTNFDPIFDLVGMEYMQ